MKALLLAAGLGTRLGPITDSKPKCLLTIGGRPMLDRWIDALAGVGVDEVLVNVHHLPELVQDHVAGHAAPPMVRTVFEPELLGSAGTLRANRSWIEPEKTFLACYADNLTDFDLSLLLERHEGSDMLATVAVFHADDPSSCGVVSVDSSGRMIGFEEKPSNPKGDLVNAGIYAFDSKVLNEIVGCDPKDIGSDLLPRLIGRSQTVLVDGYFRDIGSVDAYRLAQAEWGARSQR